MALSVSNGKRKRRKKEEGRRKSACGPSEARSRRASASDSLEPP
jgi:hypothetical protein